MKGAVDGEDAARGQQRGDALEHAFDLRPGHDVAGIRGERGVDIELREGPTDVEGDRRRIGDPLADIRQVVRDVARLPDELRQIRREVRGVLAGAGADLENFRPVGEDALQNRKDRLAIPLGGLGERLQAARRTGMRRGPKGRSNRPKRPAIGAPQCRQPPDSVNW